MTDPSQSPQRRRSGNPAVRAGAEPPRPAGPSRAGVERRSRPVLVALSALPRWLVLVVALAFVVAGLAIPGVVGGVVLLLFAAMLVWLLVLSWPVLTPAARVIRLVLLLMLVVYAGAKLGGLR